MIGRRLIAAAWLLIPFLGLLWADLFYSGDAYGIWLAPWALLFALLAANEVVVLLAARDLRPRRWVIYAGTALLVLAAAAPAAWPLFGLEYPQDSALARLAPMALAMSVCVLMAFAGELLEYEQPGKVIVNISLAIMAVSYVGLMIGIMLQLRMLIDNAWGMLALVSLWAVVKFSDVAALAVGSMIGRTKLVPRISPGKTVEGAIAGIAGGILAGWVVFELVAPRLVGETVAIAPWRWILYSLVVAIFGILGDLAESMLKRDTGKKDSGWIPGLGGVLDVIDSPVMAAPVAYACWAVGLIGPGA